MKTLPDMFAPRRLRLRWTLFTAIAGICILFLVGKADATPEPEPETKELNLVHIPNLNWDGGRDQQVRVLVESSWKLKTISLHYRQRGQSAFKVVEMKRAANFNYVATVPGDEVQPPGLEYFVQTTSEDDTKVARVASKERPLMVSVHGDTDATLRLERAARHDGRRNKFLARGEYFRPGPRVTSADEPPLGTETETEPGSDTYWVADLEYRYRTFGLLYDFSFGVGVMRGTRPTLASDPSVVVGEPEAGDPGINYGHAGATLEFGQYFSVEPRVFLGATEAGFTAGGGGLLRVGEIEGTRMEVGGDVLGDVGSRAFFRFAWNTVPKVPMSMTVETTTWPNKTVSANRLYLEAEYAFPSGLRVGGRLGSMTRTDGLDPGIVAGVHSAWEF